MAEKASENIIESSAIAYFSIIMMGISAAILSFFMYQATERFTSLDRMPELLAITPESQEQLGTSPGIAHVGLYIKDFTEFDILKNQFEFSGILWFLFDPSIISLDTLGKFSFEKGKIVAISPPSTRLVEGKLLARYDIRVSLKTDLTFSLFPFDSHTLYITLDNNYVTPGELVFESSVNEFIVSPEISITGWREKGIHVFTGFSTSYLERQTRVNDVSHPRAIFAIDYTHSGMRQALTIFLPLMFLFFLSLFSFALDPKNYTSILGLSSGAVTGLLAYRFVIENLSPKVGYFMLSDYIFFLLLAGVFLIFFINIALLEVRQRYKKLIIVFIHTAMVVSFFYLLKF